MEGGSIGLIAALVCAVIFAGVGGAVLGRMVVGEVAVSRARGVAGETALLLVGVRGLRPAATWLMARVAGVRRWASEAKEVCRWRGKEADEAALVSLGLTGCIAGAICGFLVGGGLFGGVLGGAFVVVVAAIAVSQLRGKDVVALRNQTPLVLQSVSRCLQAGMSLQQTFAQVAVEVPGGFSQVFARGANMMETGAPAEAALDYVRQACGVEELSFLTIALDVQHRAGGSMAEVLASAEKTVTARLDLARSLETQTAQAKLSAQVVTALPFVLLGVLSLMSPAFAAPLFSGAAGYVILGLAVLLQVGGILMVRRILAEAQ